MGAVAATGAAARGASARRGAAGAGAAAAGAAAAGARPGNEIPLGSNWARPAVLAIGAGSCERSGETRLAGAVAERSPERRPTARCRGRRELRAAAAGSSTRWRRAAGVRAWPRPGVACAPDMADAMLCISCGAAACTFDSWVSSCGAGVHRRGRCAGSAAAVPLSASAVRPRPRRRSWSKQTVSGCGSWFSQSLDGEGLKPKLARYWCDSSDTCGVYATVTEAKAFGDRSLESVG